MRHHARRLAVFSYMALLLLILAGCGDEGSGAPSLSPEMDASGAVDATIPDFGVDPAGGDAHFGLDDATIRDADSGDAMLGPDASPDSDMNISDTGGVRTDGGDPSAPCANGDAIDLNVDGQRTGDIFYIEGRTGSEDIHQGTCSPDSRLGSERLVRFRAPSAGTWSIRTLPSEPGFDTLIYVRTGCQDTAQELACNDDIEAGRILQSRVTVELAVDQTIYIFVDHWSGLGEDPFELEVRPFEEGVTPVINGGAMVVDNEAATISILFEGEGARGRRAMRACDIGNRQKRAWSPWCRWAAPARRTATRDRV